MIPDEDVNVFLPSMGDSLCMSRGNVCRSQEKEQHEGCSRYTSDRWKCQPR